MTDNPELAELHRKKLDAIRAWERLVAENQRMWFHGAETKDFAKNIYECMVETMAVLLAGEEIAKYDKANGPYQEDLEHEFLARID